MEKQAHPLLLLSPREATKLLNPPAQTIRDMIKHRKSLAFTVANRNLFVTISDSSYPLTFAADLQFASQLFRRQDVSLVAIPLACRIAVATASRIASRSAWPRMGGSTRSLMVSRCLATGFKVLNAHTETGDKNFSKDSEIAVYGLVPDISGA
jgi:hypothetical protein